ncbi:unnamed protein product, partial [Hapterophycus canaliculatus]
LLFFFSPSSGLLHMLAFMAETTMISVCWAGDNLIGLIKVFKFLELASSNMLAVTNLAICVNLALIIMRAQDWIIASSFFIEFFVGVSMLVIVTWLLLFRVKEIKECYKIHTRIRYYFGLTLIATAVNLAVGVCGTIYLARDLEG